MAIIYGLFDPDTDKIRYVGATKRRLQERMINHCSDARNDTTKRCRRIKWISSLLEQGKKPIGVVIEKFCEELEDMHTKEKQWIKDIRAGGADLTNETDGGAVMPQISKEGRERIRLSCLGRKSSEVTRQRLRDSHIGKNLGELNPLAKITSEQAAAIYLDKRTYREIGHAYQVSKNIICSIKTKRCWAHITSQLKGE